MSKYVIEHEGFDGYIEDVVGGILGINPEDVDKDKISARVEDGVLTITLPKLQEEKKSNVREISIK